jgi:hypothetical protein
VINECTIGLITPYNVHGILTIELDRSFGTINTKLVYEEKTRAADLKYQARRRETGGRKKNRIRR